MRRYNNLKEKVLSFDNFIKSEDRARKGKLRSYGVRRFDKLGYEGKIKALNDLKLLLNNNTYKTSEYTTYKIYEPKERLIFRLPYYPDRIVHHVLMSVLEPIFVNWFIKNTYSCIKNRGIHKMQATIEHALQHANDTKWCLKLDIRKFYPSINNAKLSRIMSQKIKDKWMMNVLNEIIFSSDKGVPIGNYLSQFFANAYLTKIDHYIKEVLGIKHYYRYCDDIVIFGSNKQALYKIYRLIKQKLSFLDLTLKPPRLFYTESGVDFAGYVFRHKYTLLRKSMKLKFIKAVKRTKDLTSIKQKLASYYGWLIHCDGIHLLKMYIKDLYYGFKKHYFKCCGTRTCKLGRCRKVVAKR